MGRIRTIKPEFWTDEDMAALDPYTRLLAIGLLNYADDEGYFNANPALVKAAVFPLDEGSANIPGGLVAVASRGRIVHLRAYGLANVELSRYWAANGIPMISYGSETSLLIGAGQEVTDGIRA